MHDSVAEETIETMHRGYGQYCPLALATELLCRRWTILVMSRLVDGCVRFNEIHRGLPQMSPTLLSQRLKELEEAGLVESHTSQGRKGRDYLPTPAGRDLVPIVDQMAVWGQQWARDNTLDDLDPSFLAWSMHTRMDTASMPTGRTVLEFEFTGTPDEFRRFWLVCDDGKIEMCLKDPGFEVDVAVKSDLRRFVEAWRGFRDLKKEIRSGKIQVFGPANLVRQLPSWLLLSGLAPHERLRPGREKRIARKHH